MDISSNNRQTLKHLFKNQLIDIKGSNIFDNTPIPMPIEFNYDRIEGMMLGLAIGDALGITTEGMRARERYNAYGEIRDYIPNRYVDKPIGFPSDDTQLAFWTLEQMIEDE